MSKKAHQLNMMLHLIDVLRSLSTHRVFYKKQLILHRFRTHHLRWNLEHQHNFRDFTVIITHRR